MKKFISSFLLLIIALCLPMSTHAYQYQGPETELVFLINKEREARNIPPIYIDWEITRLARYKSEEMINHRLFDHESLVYGNPAQLLDTFHVPYNLVGANIAMGHEAPRHVIEAWCTSPGHYVNVVNPNFTKAGVGLSWDDGIPYWTLILVG